MAGLLLDYSLKHPKLSLYSLFGSTVSRYKANREGEDDSENRKRAAGTRLKIFWEVTTANLPIGLYELANRIGEDPRLVSLHLITLGELGILNYESQGFGKPFSAYKLTDKGVAELSNRSYRYNILTSHPVLFQIFMNNQDSWLTGENLVEKFANIVHKEEVSQRRKIQIMRTIQSPLSNWLKEGYIEVRDLNDSLRSTIDLTEEQRSNLVELLEILERFQNQNPGIIAQGLSVSRELTTTRISELMAKAKKNSPSANKRSVEEFYDDLSIILKDRALNPGEIAKIIREQGMRVSTDGIRNRLKKLEKRALVERSSQQHNATWSLKGK